MPLALLRNRKAQGHGTAKTDRTALSIYPTNPLAVAANLVSPRRSYPSRLWACEPSHRTGCQLVL